MFAHCTCAINSSEHFTITYQGTDVLLTAVAGGGGTFGLPKMSSVTAWSRPNLIGNSDLRAISTVNEFRSFPAAMPTSLSSNLRMAPAVSDFQPAFSGAAWMRANLSSAQFRAFSARPDAGGIFRNSVGLRDATRGARAQTMFGNSMGAPRLKTDASGLRNRSVVGGLSWGISDSLSKPKPGFAVY